jgi:hypothetical protein
MISKMVKSVLRARRGVASASLVFPLPPAEQYDPKRIDIAEWHRLPIDRRAPVRSVAMVDVVHDRVYVLVIDVVAGQALWQIQASLAQLGLIYSGMSGDDAHARGTLVVSARLLPRGQSLGGGGVARRSLGVQDLEPPLEGDDCTPQPEVPGDHTGGTGSPGMIARASLYSDLQTSLVAAIEVQVIDGEGNEQDALLVSPEL